MAASSPRNDLVKIYRCTDSLVDLFTGRAGVVLCLLLHLPGFSIFVRFQYTGEAAEPDSDHLVGRGAEHRAVLNTYGMISGWGGVGRAVTYSLRYNADQIIKMHENHTEPDSYLVDLYKKEQDKLSQPAPLTIQTGLSSLYR